MKAKLWTTAAVAFAATIIEMVCIYYARTYGGLDVKVKIYPDIDWLN